MNLDRKLFEEFLTGMRYKPVFRLYEWDKPTISLGINQVAGEVVNLDAAARLSYEIVRRPTGGRALLHKGDICYAVVGSRRMHPLFTSLTSTYRAIGLAISQTLELSGIAGVNLPSSGNDTRRSLNPCFALLSPFEVTVQGKKICGSAQYRSGDFFLQHGSIRIQDNWNDDDYYSIWPDGYSLGREKVTCVDVETGLLNDPAVIAERLIGAMQSVFEIAF